MEILSNAFDWSHMSGTSWNGTVLSVTPLGRKIRPKSSDTGKWYINPPINLMGPVITFQSKSVVDIKITVNLTNPSINSYIDLYGTVPIAYDEWRVDGRNVRIAICNNIVNVRINMVSQFTSKINVNTAIIGINVNNNVISFNINGLNVGSFTQSSSNPVFNNGKIYFGFDADLGGGFNVTSIIVNGGIISNNSANLIKTYDMPTNSLRYLASKLNRPIWVGTCINADALLAYPKYGEILAQQFSMVTPENHFKFQFIHPQQNQFAFAEADAIVAFCNLNNIRIHGHCLVWHEAIPSWVWDIYNSKNYTLLHQILMDHITTLVTRYKGVIKEWDTLNEVFSSDSTDSEGFRSNAEQDNFASIWYKAFGKQIYIDALKLVKQIDPEAENWVNDYAIDQKSSVDKVKQMITFVNYANNLGFGKLIDGIGFQSHNYDPQNDPSNYTELLSNMQLVVKSCGIKVRVSELDVEGASKVPTLFSDKLQVCISPQNPNCASFGMWGFTDLTSSYNSPTTKEKHKTTNYKYPNWGAQYDDSLMLDENFVSKKAVASMIGVLQKGN